MISWIWVEIDQKWIQNSESPKRGMLEELQRAQIWWMWTRMITSNKKYAYANFSFTLILQARKRGYCLQNVRGEKCQKILTMISDNKMILNDFWGICKDFVVRRALWKRTDLWVNLRSIIMLGNDQEGTGKGVKGKRTGPRCSLNLHCFLEGEDGRESRWKGVRWKRYEYIIFTGEKHLRKFRLYMSVLLFFIITPNFYR